MIAPQHMPRAQYDRIEAVNFSTLKAMALSPLHYQHARAERPEPTWAMILGNVVHMAVLEPDRLPVDCAVFRGARRAGKEWDAFEAANAGRIILKEPEYEHALAIRDAVHAHPLAASLLARGAAEQSLTWTDEVTGLACKARLDWVGPGVLVDLKTARTVEARQFGAMAARLLYHVQMAHYRAGLMAWGIDVPTKIIAVENTAPYDVAVFDVDEHALYAGEEQRRELLDRVAECTRSGLWPGRYADALPLELPSWVFPDDEDADGMGLDFGGEA
jgi:exodeoxyribonuclease VIII